MSHPSEERWAEESENRRLARDVKLVQVAEEFRALVRQASWHGSDIDLGDRLVKLVRRLEVL